MDFSTLTSYADRQVVINEYLDVEGLIERHGFHFQSVTLEENKITFIKKDNHMFHIPIDTFTQLYINDEFQNYYTLKVGSKMLEIYFP